MVRPDLTYLTQANFDIIGSDTHSTLWVNDCQIMSSLSTTMPKILFIKPISKLPELVQCAEMLFDMTLDKPNSIIHKMVSDLLNELKEEK